jgi:hypothetical protein
MAVVDLDGDGFDEVVFASTFSPVDVIVPSGGQRSRHMRSVVHVLKYQNGALNVISSAPLGDPDGAHDFHGYGAAGIAVGDLKIVGEPAGLNVVVTTLNGELIVFKQSGGVLNPAPVFRTFVDGSLGAFNSIVIDNLDEELNGPKPELYIAGSMGVRKFYAPGQ